MIRDEFSLLFAHLGDLCKRAETGEICVSAFLSPRERHFAEQYLAELGFKERFLAFGGYVGAERCRLFILPDYVEKCDVYADLLQFFDTDTISVLKISGSGYRRLSHRDYLGSLLSLGIEREVLGDIVIISEEKEEAIVFCDTVISDFVLHELKKIANDSVKVARTVIDGDFTPRHLFSHISDTVASARIDCVVASLCSLSRDKARTAVVSGLVEIDYENETAPDKTVSAPCLVSVRGYGKFKLNSVSDKTRKGRFRLDADKYI